MLNGIDDGAKKFPLKKKDRKGKKNEAGNLFGFNTSIKRGIR